MATITTMKSIVNHRRDGDAVRMADKYIKSKANPNQRRLRETTVGWHFLGNLSRGAAIGQGTIQCGD